MFLVNKDIEKDTFISAIKVSRTITPLASQEDDALRQVADITSRFNAKNVQAALIDSKDTAFYTDTDFEYDAHSEDEDIIKIRNKSYLAARKLHSGEYLMTINDAIKLGSAIIPDENADIFTKTAIIMRHLTNTKIDPSLISGNSDVYYTNKDLGADMANV